MYIPAQADEVFSGSDDKPEHSGHCWCNRTLAEIGFDDKLAAVQSCKGRFSSLMRQRWSNTSSACARVLTNTIEVLCWRRML